MLSRQLGLLGVLGAFAVGCGGGGSHPGGTVAGTAGSNAGTAGTTESTAGTTGSAGVTGVAGTTGSAGTTGTSGATGAAGMAGAAGTAGAAGSAGTTGAAGVTGAAGTTGAGGTVATGGTTGAGGRPSGRSAGCDMAPPNDPIGNAVNHPIAITGLAQQYLAGYADRTYCSTIPKSYNPATAYPLVIYGPGCGGLNCEGGPFTGRTDIVLIQATKAPKVYNGDVPPVPPAAAPGCFQTGVISTVDSPELNYFDQVVAEIESKLCIDKGKVFVAGTSSGGWFANYLGCARGNVIRGIAADSGGIPVDRPACTGGAAAMEFPGDSAMDKDSMGREIGVALARDLFIKTNGCTMSSTQMKFGNATCDYYGGCSSPVAWCNTGGGHQAGQGYLNPSGWPFWSALQ